jgi:hypothetical protein
MVVNAALTQFKSAEVLIHRYPVIREKEKIDEIMSKAQKERAVVVFTFVVSELRRKAIEEGMRKGVPTIDIMGPLLSRLEDLLEISPLSIPGLFRELREEYYRRIEAIDFSVKHDDGRNVENIDEADLVLVGVSRTSKTPISIYLAYRGFRTANIPVTLEHDLPAKLDQLPSHKVIGLTIDPKRLKEIREVRAKKMKLPENSSYVDFKIIKSEVYKAERIFREKGWKIVDVTSKSIEECATIIMELIGKKISERVYEGI